MSRTSIFADISLLLVAFVWGTTFVIVQNAISFLEPLSFNGVRFTLATFILSLWLIMFNRDQLKQISKKMILSGIIIGFWLFVGYATQTFGLLYTTSSKAGFITGLSVVLVPLFSIFLLKQKPSWQAIFGITVATVGLYLLTMTDSVSLNIGDLLVFVCAIGFALQIIFTGKYSSNYPSLLLTIIQLATVSILSLIGAFLFEDWQSAVNPEILLNSNVIVALFITSIFATALAFFVQTSVQKFTTPTRVALIFAMEPVFAAICGYLWAGDRLALSASFGCILIFTGMILAELPTWSFIKRKKVKDNNCQKVG